MFTQIEVRGPDAAPFLQAQLTQDIARVVPEMSPLAAWCNPKGRVVVVLRLVALDDGVALVLPKALAPDVLRQLQRYRLRARVELSEAPESWRSLAVQDDGNLARLDEHGLRPGPAANASRQHHGVTAVRLDAAQTAIELYGEASAMTALGLHAGAAVPPSDWAAARISAGIADIGTDASGRYTPHMLNLDRLEAVNFDKGCYTGQEVIARTEYRGNAKRRLMHYRADADVGIGDKLRYDGKEVGEVVVSSGRDFLALTPSELHDARLSTGNGEAVPAGSGA